MESKEKTPQSYPLKVQDLKNKNLKMVCSSGASDSTTTTKVHDNTHGLASVYGSQFYDYNQHAEYGVPLLS